MRDIKNFTAYVYNHNDTLNVIPDGSETVYVVYDFIDDFCYYLEEINYKIEYDKDGYRVTIPLEIYEKYFRLVCRNTDEQYDLDEFSKFELDENGYIKEVSYFQLTTCENPWHNNGFLNIHDYMTERLQFHEYIGYE